MVNEGSALWSRPRGEIGEDQYREFYHHVAHVPGDPWHTIHLACRRADRVHRPALRTRHQTLRPVRPDAPARRAALRQAGLHHRRVRGAAAALSPLRAGRRGFRRSRAQRQSRDPAERPDPGKDPRRAGQAGPLRPREAGQEGARGVRVVLAKLRRGAEGRALRGRRAEGQAAPARALPVGAGRRALALPRRVCRGHAGAAGGDLLHQRRGPAGAPAQPADRGVSARAASTSCSWPTLSTSSGCR